MGRARNGAHGTADAFGAVVGSRRGNDLPPRNPDLTDRQFHVLQHFWWTASSAEPRPLHEISRRERMGNRGVFTVGQLRQPCLQLARMGYLDRENDGGLVRYAITDEGVDCLDRGGRNN